MRLVILLGMLVVLLAGCVALNPQVENENPPGSEPGMMSGMMNGMMGRHHAQIPEAYAGLTNPISADEESLERGAAIYTEQCASCHGDGGMGDGPAGAALDPQPAAIAHTSQMMGDDYLFWRISEGGGLFSSAMPGWKDTLDEQSRWELINYIRALGTGDATPKSSMGGTSFDPQIEATRQADMLAQAVEKGVITGVEVGIFQRVHAALDTYRIDHPELLQSGDDATERQAAMLGELVKSQIISSADADAFADIHNRLGASGLMP